MRFDMPKDIEQQQLAVDYAEELAGTSIESVPMEGTPSHKGWEGLTVAGKFALLEWLGGSADRGVFLTLRPGAHKAAIKLIKAEGSEAEAYLTQWETAKTLSNRHLMPVLDFGRCTIEDTNLVYVVTEYAERVLSQFIQHRALGPDETKDVVQALLDGLAHLHANGIIHGHLKPSNIFIVAEELKLSGDEFLMAGGIRRTLTARSTYDAPEVGEATVTAAADVWSLGVTVVEALTQRLPVWDGSTMHQPVVPDSLPGPFLVLARRCLPIDPSWRYTLDEVRAHLDNVRADLAHSEASAAAAAGLHAGAGLQVGARIQAATESADLPVARPLFPKATDPAAAFAPEPRATRPERRAGVLDRRAAAGQQRTKFQDRRAAAAEPTAPVPERAAAPEPRIVPEPVVPPPAEERPAAARPMSRWASDEEPTTRGLFEDIEEANLTRNSLLPLVFGIVLVLVIAGFALVRSGMVKVSWPFGQPSAPAARQSAPVPPPESTSSEIAQTPAGSPETEKENAPPAPDEATKQPGTTAWPAAATASAVPSAAAPSAPMQGVSTPLEAKQAVSRERAVPGSTKEATKDEAKSQAQPEEPSPPRRPSNANGEVATRVLPSPSLAATSSMHEPLDVVLRVTVDRSGKVADASYVSPGPGNYFARISQRAAEGWTFNPPLRGGQAQPSVWRLRFYFWRQKLEATATEEER
jgi:hypothetical protein